MSVIKIDSNNYIREVVESEQVVLLDFYADWCGPCRMLGPVIEKIAEENPHIKVGKVNVDEEQELAAKFQVMSIPSLFVLRNGEVEAHSLGVKPEAEILAMVEG